MFTFKKVLIFSVSVAVVFFGFIAARAAVGPDFMNGATFPGSGIWNDSGSVGIGTTDPGSNKLYVLGNTYLNGTTYSSGALYSANDIYTNGAGD
ncbi:MAG: hypothetical protein WC146_03575, partial [Patescibacteria group bacterium]